MVIQITLSYSPTDAAKVSLETYPLYPRMRAHLEAKQMMVRGFMGGGGLLVTSF